MLVLLFWQISASALWIQSILLLKSLCCNCKKNTEGHPCFQQTVLRACREPLAARHRPQQHCGWPGQVQQKHKDCSNHRWLNQCHWRCGHYCWTCFGTIHHGNIFDCDCSGIRCRHSRRADISGCWYHKSGQQFYGPQEGGEDRAGLSRQNS